ncbi:MAG: cell wall-active antibiotics response protein [Bacteroidales bacterium]|jgi:predicted membrane protein|nr:cell wall-active antibiotics response protein [Bacteroidales bacterium]
MKLHHIKTGSVIFGLLFIMAGALLFAFNAGFLPPAYRQVVFSWPMFLVATGFVFLFSRHKWLGGIILMLIGGFFLLPKLDIERLSFITRNGWALILMSMGIAIVVRTLWIGRDLPRRGHEFREKWDRHCEQRAEEWKRRHRDDSYKRERCRTESGYIERDYIFGGTSEKIDIRDFKGGEINCVFGGMELDLSDSQLAEGVHHLELNSVFGGVVLYIPVEWKVEIRQTQVFGNFVDNRPKPGFEVDENSVLIVTASSVFGGGEIKCREQ